MTLELDSLVRDLEIELPKTYDEFVKYIHTYFGSDMTVNNIAGNQLRWFLALQKLNEPSIYRLHAFLACMVGAIGFETLGKLMSDWVSAGLNLGENFLDTPMLLSYYGLLSLTYKQRLGFKLAYIEKNNLTDTSPDMDIRRKYYMVMYGYPSGKVASTGHTNKYYSILSDFNSASQPNDVIFSEFDKLLDLSNLSNPELVRVRGGFTQSEADILGFSKPAVSHSPALLVDIANIYEDLGLSPNLGEIRNNLNSSLILNNLIDRLNQVFDKYQVELNIDNIVSR